MEDNAPTTDDVRHRSVRSISAMAFQDARSRETVLDPCYVAKLAGGRRRTSARDQCRSFLSTIPPVSIPAVPLAERLRPGQLSLGPTGLPSTTRTVFQYSMFNGMRHKDFICRHKKWRPNARKLGATSLKDRLLAVFNSRGHFLLHQASERSLLLQ